MLDSAPRARLQVLCSRELHFEGELPALALEVQIVIGITVHNQAHRLSTALASALSQTVIEEGQAVVVLLDDQSTDDWRERCCEVLSDPRIVVANGVCGSAARARNALLDLVDGYLPCARWVARLDADDILASRDSVAALCRAGDQADAQFVLGSNHLAEDGVRLEHDNIADPELLQNHHRLLGFIEAFCLYGAKQELPSCNLILRCRSGIRYPDVRSAEDHWLVAQLLIFSSEAGVIVPDPAYATYSLGGPETKHNRRSAHWAVQRRRLAEATRSWVDVLEYPVSILGVGQEGIVWRAGSQVFKQFYSWAMDAESLRKLEALCANLIDAPVPNVQWVAGRKGAIHCQYSSFESHGIEGAMAESAMVRFLSRLYRNGLITSNIKRTNLRLTDDGEIVYIDIGEDIVPFSPSRFLDAAARLYSIGILGHSDHELARRPSWLRQHEALASLDGFAQFYRSLIEDIFPHCRLAGCAETPSALRVEPRVTLLIKACAQDAAHLEDQVRHIVSQVSFPAKCHSVVLTLDSYIGPYLRQFATGDLARAKAIAAALQAKGIVDQVWVAPHDSMSIGETYQRWFGRRDVLATHTRTGAPLFSQLWAFDRVTTQYVLQCDVDVLVGRQDFQHDFLEDMLRAARLRDVLCVGFNIPQPLTGFKPYSAEAGEFVPEIRFGLLDLARLRAQTPLVNPVRDKRFEWMWHRAIHRSQQTTRMKCVRGGDSRSFYVHPCNIDKARLPLPVVRDLVAQGTVPLAQRGKWDVDPAAGWIYPPRYESLIFLMKGRDTSYAKLKRSIDSLALQKDDRFGVILIDDGSGFEQTWFIPQLLGRLGERTTLIRRARRYGYIPNFIDAVEQVCQNDNALIVTLDLDDALMSRDVSARLLREAADGADLVHGVMFRPDKPLHLYEPDYSNPRSKGGGNTWLHLRGFRKGLFLRVPKSHFRVDGAWVDELTDYAIMVPATELATKPVFIDDIFCYYHERDPYPPERKARQLELLSTLLSREALSATAGIADTA